MADRLPTLIVTGASGFVGRTFVQAALERFKIYAIARRSRHQSRVPNHPNLQWIQVDIGHTADMERVTAKLEEQGGADYVVHLAAHYDFSNENRPEYLHTNVNGTRRVLEQAKRLAVKRFVFASSVAACPLPAPGEAIDEDSPPDADFPYARSKKAGELMTHHYSRHFPCSVVRLGAVFSDWCEYAPLYVFLSTWLSNRWNARVLGGRGTAAVPYIHARDVHRIFFRLLRPDGLPRYDVYIASPDGATSHRELFELSTRFRYGKARQPVLMPKPLATLGVLALDGLGRLTGNRPFERPWMMRYVDRALAVDASRTREVLGWAPTPRLHVVRRILFLIEKMNSDPSQWTLLNQAAMKLSVERPALIVHDAMMEAEEAIADGITAYLQSPVREERFPRYAAMPRDELRWYVGVVFGLLRAAVRTSDRTLLLHFVHHLARRRYDSGFPASEVCDAFLVIGTVTLEELLFKPEVASLEEYLRGAVTLSIALAIDGVQDAYDDFVGDSETKSGTATIRQGNGRSLEEIVEELNAFHDPTKPPSTSADGITAVSGRSPRS